MAGVAVTVLKSGGSRVLRLRLPVPQTGVSREEGRTRRGPTGHGAHRADGRGLPPKRVLTNEEAGLA